MVRTLSSRRPPVNEAKKLLSWFAAHARDLPWRHTKNPYAIWISEIMLQQTQVKTVIPYWERWMTELPDLATLARTPLERLYKLWEGLGYYHRVRNIHRAAQTIVREHNGIFPSTLPEVLDLPGIGRYTAGAICSIAFNNPAPVLDGNVIRVLTRFYGIKNDPARTEVRESLWTLAQRLVETAGQLPARFGKERCGQLNESLMELGALICTPRLPHCSSCPLQQHCFAFHRGLVDQLPNLGSKPTVTHLETTSFVVEKRGRFLVQQRGNDSVNGELWEFPRSVSQPRHSLKKLAGMTVGTSVENLRPLCQFKHSITRYRIAASVYRGTATGKEKVPGRWLKLSAIAALPLTSADGKILRALQLELGGDAGQSAPNGR